MTDASRSARTAACEDRSRKPTTPLSGILVADFSRVLAGPLATMTLGDLGAQVVKVERPGTGDETRQWAPPRSAGGESTYYLSVNRNKRSVTLDLSTADGRAAARALAERCDVLVENFAPGTMERFGLGYDELSAGNPGLMSVTGSPESEPSKVGVALVDVLAGQNLAIGVLAALQARHRTGRGQRVEVDLLGSLLAALVNQASAYLNAGVVPERMGNRHPSIAPYETLRTADRPIAVAVGNDGQFRRLATAVGEAALADDPRFTDNPARVRNRAALVTELGARLSRHPAAHWIDRLTAAGVPCGPVNSVAEAFALASRLGTDPVVEGAGVRTVASPIGMSGTPPTYRLPPPSLGEHTEEILDWLTGGTRS